MLTDQEKQEILEELHHAPTNQAGCIDALKVVQKHRGWISDKALADVASFVDMTTAELDTVASFYNLIFRKPVGKHVILVCDSISCFLTGGETVMSYLVKKLGVEPGHTTSDGQFTLLPTVCLGHCEQGPAMMLDREIICNLDEKKIDRVLEDVLSRDIEALAQ